MNGCIYKKRYEEWLAKSSGGGGNRISKVFLLCSMCSLCYITLQLPKRISSFVWYATLNKILLEKV